MKNITVYPENNRENLLTALRRQNLCLNADCGGRGTCGKCKVRFVSEAPDPVIADYYCLSIEELDDGWRLACRTVLSRPADIQFISESEFDPESEILDYCPEPGPKILAFDIGTTTIAGTLINASSPPVVLMNHQRSFGADVISRIDASNRGYKEKLQQIILHDLKSAAERLAISSEDFENPDKVWLYISANTTMQHLLQGFSCASLGTAPYTPVDISLHDYRNMTILPGISTFVGSDIVSGIISCGMDQKDSISLLIDLGTNGEMVLGNRQRMICASTAAGPAFEGGNITCGMAGTPGAICSVDLSGSVPEICTIGNLPPAGICGTGVLEIIFELYHNGFLDETGLMVEEYFDEGYPLGNNVTFTEKDVREVQLAKSAIRSGIEVLLMEYGIRCEDVSDVYLAGGFGEKIDVKKAAGIGLIPEELADKAVPVGNSSLEGVVMLAHDPSLRQRFSDVAANTEEILLAGNRHFQELYMDFMLFPEDT